MSPSLNAKLLFSLTRWNETLIRIGKVSKVRSTGYRNRNHITEKMDFSLKGLISATLSVSVFYGSAEEPKLSSLKMKIKVTFLEGTMSIRAPHFISNIESLFFLIIEWKKLLPP